MWRCVHSTLTKKRTVVDTGHKLDFGRSDSSSPVPVGFDAMFGHQRSVRITINSLPAPRLCCELLRGCRRREPVPPAEHGACSGCSVQRRGLGSLSGRATGWGQWPWPLPLPGVATQSVGCGHRGVGQEREAVTSLRGSENKLPGLGVFLHHGCHGWGFPGQSSLAPNGTSRRKHRQQLDTLVKKPNKTSQSNSRLVAVSRIQLRWPWLLKKQVSVRQS